MELVFGPRNDAILAFKEMPDEADKGRCVGGPWLRKGEVDKAPTVSGEVQVQHMDVDAINVNHEQSRGVFGDGQKTGDLGFGDKDDDRPELAVNIVREAEDVFDGATEMRVIQLIGSKGLDPPSTLIVYVELVPKTANHLEKA